MKKKTKLLLVSLLVLTSLLIFVGCGGNADNSATTETTTETQEPESTTETQGPESTTGTESTAAGDQENATSEPEANVATTAGDPAKGQAFFEKSGCSDCHAIKGKGGTSAADLTTIGSKYDAESMKKYLTEDHPVSVNGSDEDIANLVAYLVSLK